MCQGVLLSEVEIKSYSQTRLERSRLQRIHGYNEQNQLLGLVQHVLTRECHGYSEELY